MKHSLLLICGVMLGSSIQAVASPYKKGWIDFNKNGKKDIYEDPERSEEERLTDLMQQMTLDEKAGQLLTALGWEMYERQGEKIVLTEKFKNELKEQHLGGLWGFMRADPWTQKDFKTGLNPQTSPKTANMLQRYAIENSRLGIPVMLAEEAPHGHMAIGTTVFPTSIGQASTWNPELIREIAAATAKEVRGQGGHIGYGPILDLARDPRWSRVEETYGEDPYLIGRIGEAMVRGFQGEDLRSKENIVSTLKHFAGYGWPEGGHNAGSANVGDRTLHEMILPPFKKAIDAGALSVMSSYNEMDGKPCTSDSYLLTDILKEQWGFNGFVVSDLHAIAGLTGHGVAANRREAARLALSAGVDNDLSAKDIRNHTNDLVRKGELDETVIDNAVKRVLRVKFRLGLFDNPFVDEKANVVAVNEKRHRELAREAARQSAVLLKNRNQTLPLRKDIGSIAVIGPNADNIYNMLGDYTAPQTEAGVVTVKDGIEQAVGANTRVFYAKGCAIRDPQKEGFEEAIAAAKKAEVVVMVMGGSSARDFSSSFEATGAAKIAENSISDMESGEGYDRATLDMMGSQLELMREIRKLGKPTVLVLIKGRPLLLNWCNDEMDAIVDAWYPGMEGGNGIADILFGEYNPAGRLPVSVPRSVGQLPVYYNTKRSANRSKYIEEPGTPLFPFGYGLSYSSFEYGEPTIQQQGTLENPEITVSLPVKNTGKRDGDEVVQLYVRDNVSSFTTPNKQLKAFQRIHIRAGETANVTFKLDKEAFALYQGNGKFAVEPGTFTLMCGASSEDIRSQKEITL